jgi:glycosyltransferase involved in cell wall biosynthesis
MHQLLDISVITYNRCGKLDGTLTKILSSELPPRCLSIFDNASTDETPSVLSKSKRRYPEIRIYRHDLNIGLGVNYLRALETWYGKYKRVICDDDYIDLIHPDELRLTLPTDNLDIVYVGVSSNKVVDLSLR